MELGSKVLVEEGKDFKYIFGDTYGDPSDEFTDYLFDHGQITYIQMIQDGNYMISHQWKDTELGSELIGTFIEEVGDALATVMWGGRAWVLVEADECYWLVEMVGALVEAPLHITQFVPAEDGEGILIPGTWWATFSVPNDGDILWKGDFWKAVEATIGCRVQSMNIVGVQHFKGKVQVMVGVRPASLDFKIPVLGGKVV